MIRQRARRSPSARITQRADRARDHRRTITTGRAKNNLPLFAELEGQIHTGAGTRYLNSQVSDMARKGYRVLTEHSDGLAYYVTMKLYNA